MYIWQDTPETVLLVAGVIEMICSDSYPKVHVQKCDNRILDK